MPCVALHQQSRLEPDHRPNSRCTTNLPLVVRGRPEKAGSGRGGCQRTSGQRKLEVGVLTAKLKTKKNLQEEPPAFSAKDHRDLQGGAAKTAA